MKTTLIYTILYTLFSICTPPTKILEGLEYSSRFSNQTEMEIELLFYSSSNDTDSLMIQSISWEVFNMFAVPEKEDVIRNFVDEFIFVNDSIILMIDDQPAITWIEPDRLKRKNTNSPYNYDSWEFDQYSKVVEFTITDADLIPEE